MKQVEVVAIGTCYVDTAVDEAYCVKYAGNPYLDGPLEDIIIDDKPTTTEVQRHFIDARVVKALNHMGYHHLRDEAKTRGANDRKAIAFATDSQTDVDTVAQFIDSIGFDPLYIGRLSASRPLESGGSAFGANVTSDMLKQLVDGTI